MQLRRSRHKADFACCACWQCRILLYDNQVSRHRRRSPGSRPQFGNWRHCALPYWNKAASPVHQCYRNRKKTGCSSVPCPPWPACTDRVRLHRCIHRKGKEPFIQTSRGKSACSTMPSAVWPSLWDSRARSFTRLASAYEVVVCKLYGSMLVDINEVRYVAYCAKAGDSSQLPPTQKCTLSSCTMRKLPSCNLASISCTHAGNTKPSPAWLGDARRLPTNHMDEPAPCSTRNFEDVELQMPSWLAHPNGAIALKVDCLARISVDVRTAKTRFVTRHRRVPKVTRVSIKKMAVRRLNDSCWFLVLLNFHGKDTTVGERGHLLGLGPCKVFWTCWYLFRSFFWFVFNYFHFSKIAHTSAVPTQRPPLYFQPQRHQLSFHVNYVWFNVA